MQNCCSFNMAEPKHATKTTKNLGKYIVAGGSNNWSCKNNSTTPGISMHEFPKPGNQLRNLCIKFVMRHRMADWQPSPYSCLCSAHFEPQCFHQRLGIGLEISSNITTKRLLDRSCAIPTIDTRRTGQNPASSFTTGAQTGAVLYYIISYVNLLSD
jgi:hypothetical protein